MSAPKPFFYLRDYWGFFNGREQWRRHEDTYSSVAAAKRGAKKLSLGIGVGSRVQVVRVTPEVVTEIKGPRAARR